MDSNEIRVKVKDGTLIARRNPDPDYDGIYIEFETDNGDVIDITSVECEKECLNVRCYEDVYTEDYTSKFSLFYESIKNAFS